MIDINFLKRISVKINDSGSGIIIKPCTDEYCYVFTDWHVIEGFNLEDIIVQYYVIEKDEDDEDMWSFKTEKPSNVYINEKRDVAILVMPPSMAKEFVKLRQIESGQNLYHAGFPASHQNSEAALQWNCYYIRELLEKIDHGFIAYCYYDPQTYEDLSGTSGGGVFTDDGCLIGLHQGSSVKKKNDLYSKCHIIPIKFYNKLISQNYNILEPVLFCN